MLNIHRTWDFSKLTVTGGSAGTVDSDDAKVRVSLLVLPEDHADVELRSLMDHIRLVFIQSRWSIRRY